MVIKTYTIDPSHAGLVIGKGGKDIKALQRIQGVINIRFDTSSSTYTLKVTGTESACQAVFDEVQRRISIVNARLPVIPEVMRTFVDVNDRSLDVIQLVAYGEGRDECVVARGDGNSTSHKARYIISSFSRGNLGDVFDMSIANTPQVKPNFMEFLEDKISMSFQEALDNHQGTPDEKMKFHVSPGKILFMGPGVHGKLSLLRSKITGSNGSEYMKNQNLKNFFVPNLQRRYISAVKEKLVELGFENVNEFSPETYTTVHLYVGAEKTAFSVVLALDENLETPKVAADDPRLSDEKKKAVKKVLDAKSIGDVIEVESGKSLKVTYFKLCLKIHPDKNLHPGATEAFKRLEDSYNKLLNGKAKSTDECLKVDCSASKVSENHLPPKVVKVRTKKIRMCTVTTLSAKDLDVRGNLVGYEDDKDNLSEHVREAVNACWDKRDANGKIPTLHGKSQIHISAIKQVLEAHDWAKEIPYGNHGETAVLKIKIKNMREKSGDGQIWQDCVEFDFALECDSTNREKLSGGSLASEMIELKKWVERIFTL